MPSTPTTMSHWYKVIANLYSKLKRLSEYIVMLWDLIDGFKNRP